MWQSFDVNNFRGFRHVQLQPLARINLIGGKNNTGKTALLEAIHLHNSPQNGEVLFEINNRRNTSKEKLPFDVDACSWLFFDKKANCVLETISQDEQEGQRSLQAWIDDPALAASQQSEAERDRNERAKKMLDEMQLGPMLRDLWFAGGPRLILRSELNGAVYHSISFPGPWKGLPAVGHAFYHDYRSEFIGPVGRSQESDAITFSRLDNPDRQDKLLQSLRELEPRLSQLSVRYLAPEWVIHGKIEGLSQSVPAQFMGEGIRRLLSIVLAISTAHKGWKVLIDEIENGFHYSVLKGVWQAIGVAARAADVQVFATTHSWECIQAAHRAFKEAGPYEFRYYRLDRRGDEISVKSLDERLLAAVEKSDLEVR